MDYTVLYITIGLTILNWLIRKVYNPELTDAALGSYVFEICLSKLSYEELSINREDILDAGGKKLYAHTIVHTVGSIPGALLIEYDVHPNTGKIFSISRSYYTLIRDRNHLEEIKKAVAALMIAAETSGMPDAEKERLSKICRETVGEVPLEIIRTCETGDGKHLCLNSEDNLARDTITA